MRPWSVHNRRRRTCVCALSSMTLTKKYLSQTKRADCEFQDRRLPLSTQAHVPPGQSISPRSYTRFVTGNLVPDTIVALRTIDLATRPSCSLDISVRGPYRFNPNRRSRVGWWRALADAAPVTWSKFLAEMSVGLYPDSNVFIFGLEPDCKSLRKFRIRTEFGLGQWKKLRHFCFKKK